jgi:predicted nucleic acid-binding protein
VALSILRDGEAQLVISTQVLLEFYNAATRKLRADAVSVRAIAETYARLETVVLTPDMVINAMNVSTLYQKSIWDALIIEAAASANCTRILSEGMQHGQVMRGVRIENPFL